MPGCPELTYATRCPAHSKDYERTIRTQPHRAVYKTARWARLRKRVLREEPTCRACEQSATDVDHITDLRDGGAPFDRTNLQALCRQHHSSKTMRSVNARRGVG